VLLCGSGVAAFGSAHVPWSNPFLLSSRLASVVIGFGLLSSPSDHWLTRVRNPTVEVDLWTEKGEFSHFRSSRPAADELGKFRAMVPSGASTGIHEAVELRDKAKEFGGKGEFQTPASSSFGADD
jgi:hypothetical protein